MSWDCCDGTRSLALIMVDCVFKECVFKEGTGPVLDCGVVCCSMVKGVGVETAGPLRCLQYGGKLSIAPAGSTRSLAFDCSLREYGRHRSAARCT